MSPAITTVTTSSAAIMVRARTVPLPSSEYSSADQAKTALLFAITAGTFFTVTAFLSATVAFNAGVGVRP